MVEGSEGALGKQVGGQHYKSMTIQPTEYCEKNRFTHLQSNTIKYVSRFDVDEQVPYGEKCGEIDLDKAIHCIQMMKEIYYGGEKGSKNSRWR